MQVPNLEQRKCGGLDTSAQVPLIKFKSGIRLKNPVPFRERFNFF
jgi:hypothetical protein